MPIRSKDPMQESQEFYEAMIRHLITDVPLGNGLYKPQLNLSELVQRVSENPKPAQIATQMLHQLEAKPDADRQQADLHGTWVMAALIAAFGTEDSSVQMTRKLAPRFYEAAVTMLRNAK